MEARQALRRALPDILAGSIFIVIGLAFAIASTTYEIGTPLEMGPGFFPLLLGAVLVVLGALVVLSGFVAEPADPIGSVSSRAVVVITLAIVFFGLTVRNLGVVPSVFVTALLSAFASERIPAWAALAIAITLTVVSVVLFIIVLQLRLPLLGPWLKF